MWGLSNISEYKSLSSFFVQFLTENFFQKLQKQFFFLQTNLISFSKTSTMFYENKTWASRILESISPFPFYSFSLYRKLFQNKLWNSFSNDASVNKTINHVL